MSHPVKENASAVILARSIFEPPVPTRNSGIGHVKDTGESWNHAGQC